ncbi:FAD-binding protein [Herbaspirillum sp. HC18]|nr:FAD-binding protein [Herbaspirillum sp. HC18]
MQRVAIIGGGWAGCAAGVELARRGIPVCLFESSRTLGGRARKVEVDGRLLDNGQHILLGAYSETFRLMRIVGIDPDEAMLRLPLQMRYPNGSGMDFVTPRLPAPLHMLAGLFRAKGLTGADKLALARFSTTARWMDWKLDTDCSVAELLDRFDQTDRLIKLMWRPLCIAALNTPPERASAQVFLNVLRDSLGARRSASDMLIPRVDLSTLFPIRAAEFIERHGGTIRLGTGVRQIRRDGESWLVETTDPAIAASQRFDAVIVATQPGNVSALIDGFEENATLASLEFEPITTCYLQYAPTFALEQPFFALVDDVSAGHWGQFVFDRGQLDPANAGLISVVVSASSDAIEQGHDALAGSIAAQLAEAFNNPLLRTPAWTRVISEKRATFACTPALPRPSNDTGLEGLFIAGDYTAGDYPATLESAVRSAVAAASRIVS